MPGLQLIHQAGQLLPPGIGEEGGLAEGGQLGDIDPQQTDRALAKIVHQQLVGNVEDIIIVVYRLRQRC